MSTTFGETLVVQSDTVKAPIQSEAGATRTVRPGHVQPLRVPFCPSPLPTSELLWLTFPPWPLQAAKDRPCLLVDWPGIFLGT